MATVNDLYSVTTPIDSAGPFGLVSFEGEEGLSRLFHFRLELVSSNTASSPVTWSVRGSRFRSRAGRGGIATSMGSSSGWPSVDCSTAPAVTLSNWSRGSGFSHELPIAASTRICPPSTSSSKFLETWVFRITSRI